MTLGNLYKEVVELGILADPRSDSQIKQFLKFRKKEWDKFTSKEKKILHDDWIWNPYDDTRIIYGDPKGKVKVAYVGIDIGTSELLLIDRLNEKRAAEKKPLIDLVVAHHPDGYALGGLANVMDDIHVEVLRQAGVPVNITEKLLANRIRDVNLSIHSANLERASTAAKLLDLPLMCTHTVSDNNAYQIIKRTVDKLKPYCLRDIVDGLMKLPIYKKAESIYHRVVEIYIGSPESRAGKVMIGGFTGGTEGNPEVLEYVVNTAGVGTSIDMHMSSKHREMAEKYRLNSIVANHMASDSLGMQVIVDMMRKNGIEVIPGSGYIEAPLPNS
jgi:hypothetical protein